MQIMPYGKASLAVAALRASTALRCYAGLCGGTQSQTESKATTRDATLGFVIGAGIESSSPEAGAFAAATKI